MLRIDNLFSDIVDIQYLVRIGKKHSEGKYLDILDEIFPP